MKKNTFFCVVILLISCITLHAQTNLTHSGMIVLVKKTDIPPSPTNPIPPKRPKAPARPLFEAYQTAEQIDVTALTDMGSVQLVVVNRLTGIVYNETHTMGTDAVVSVATYAWASGYYTIHIYYGDNNLLSGDFILE